MKFTKPLSETATRTRFTKLYKNRFYCYEWIPGHFYVYDIKDPSRLPVGFPKNPEIPISCPLLSTAHSLCDKILRKEPQQ